MASRCQCVTVSSTYQSCNSLTVLVLTASVALFVVEQYGSHLSAYSLCENLSAYVWLLITVASLSLSITHVHALLLCTYTLVHEQTMAIIYAHRTHVHTHAYTYTCLHTPANIRPTPSPPTCSTLRPWTM